MRQREYAKTAALAVGMIVLAVQALRSIGLLPGGVWVSGLAVGAPWWARLIHPFIHAGMGHALLNVYVLWQLVFFFHIRLRHLFFAYVVACLCPAGWAGWSIVTLPAGIPVVGLSGILYVLMGGVMTRLERKARFNAVIMGWTAFATVMGGVAVGLHLYAYVVGALSAMLVRRR